jgi:hypothetical protein
MYKRMAKRGTIQTVHDYGWRLEFLSLVVRFRVKIKGGQDDLKNQEDSLRH